MNDNSTDMPALESNTHPHTWIPHYMNPVCETSPASPNMGMTSSSLSTHKEANLKATPKTTGTVCPPSMTVKQQPAQSTMHHAQGLNIYNGEHRTIEEFEANAPRNWSSGLFACFDDWSSCLLGSLFPCCLAMTISCSLNECCCTANCYPVATRTKIRTEYNIVGTICEDAYILCWCYQCALCQMAREIDVSSPDNYRE